MAKFDRSGADLEKVGMVFSNLTSSLNTEPLQAVQTEMAPILAGHTSKVYTFPGLFEKIEAVWNQRQSADLSPEQIRLCERLYMDFCRHGAKLDEQKKVEYAGGIVSTCTCCNPWPLLKVLPCASILDGEEPC